MRGGIQVITLEYRWKCDGAIKGKGKRGVVDKKTRSFVGVMSGSSAKLQNWDKYVKK